MAGVASMKTVKRQIYTRPNNHNSKQIKKRFDGMLLGNIWWDLTNNYLGHEAYNIKVMIINEIY